MFSLSFFSTPLPHLLFKCKLLYNISSIFCKGLIQEHQESSSLDCNNRFKKHIYVYSITNKNNDYWLKWLHSHKVEYRLKRNRNWTIWEYACASIDRKHSFQNKNNFCFRRTPTQTDCWYYRCKHLRKTKKLSGQTASYKESVTLREACTKTSFLPGPVAPSGETALPEGLYLGKACTQM